jgi:hypothetical protein
MNVLNIHGIKILLNQELYKRPKEIIGMERE